MASPHRCTFLGALLPRSRGSAAALIATFSAPHWMHSRTNGLWLRESFSVARLQQSLRNLASRPREFAAEVMCADAGSMPIRQGVGEPRSWRA